MNINLFTRCMTGIILAMMLFIMPITCMSAAYPPSIRNVIEEVEPPPTDLVDERPTVVGKVWTYSVTTVEWVWGLLRNNVFSWIIPPTPTSVVNSVSKKDTNQLFKILDYAGYRLKEIKSGVGLIPTLSFKFGQANELSEADYEYLESMVEKWERTNSGVYASLQRKIITTIISVNLSGDYQVSTLNVKLLPLPDVSFIMTPKQIFLGEESSTLLHAILRVERWVRGLSQNSKK
jgi:hypothetical protein